jgi:alkylhydroperoxidase/carboxymuconolactone decarboxylase family protein YurZ
MSETPPDLTTFLTDAEIAALRAGYDRAAMTRSVIGTVGRSFAGIVPLFEVLEAEIYDPAKMHPQDRQRVILALVAPRANAVTLSAHTYWALAEGLSLRDVYQVLAVAAFYAGVDAFAHCAFLLRNRTLPLLKELAAGGAPVPVQRVVHAIAALA